MLPARSSPGSPAVSSTAYVLNPEAEAHVQVNYSTGKPQARVSTLACWGRSGSQMLSARHGRTPRPKRTCRTQLTSRTTASPSSPTPASSPSSAVSSTSLPPLPLSSSSFKRRVRGAYDLLIVMQSIMQRVQLQGSSFGVSDNGSLRHQYQTTALSVLLPSRRPSVPQPRTSSQHSSGLSTP